MVLGILAYWGLAPVVTLGQMHYLAAHRKPSGGLLD
jgi:hypothetical protein